jgi:hypothetical protein
MHVQKDLSRKTKITAVIEEKKEGSMLLPLNENRRERQGNAFCACNNSKYRKFYEKKIES